MVAKLLKMRMMPKAKCNFWRRIFIIVVHCIIGPLIHKDMLCS